MLCYFEQILEAPPYKTAIVWSFTSKEDKEIIPGTTEEVRINS